MFSKWFKAEKALQITKALVVGGVCHTCIIISAKPGTEVYDYLTTNVEALWDLQELFILNLDDPKI